LQANPDSTGEPTELPLHLLVNGKNLPEKLFLFRQKLYLKAKREPAFRFYALYDRIYRRDVLAAAWDLVAANDGAPGVDGLSIEQVQKSRRFAADDRGGWRLRRSIAPGQLEMCSIMLKGVQRNE
jgi:hypothetical protein